MKIRRPVETILASFCVATGSAAVAQTSHDLDHKSPSAATLSGVHDFDFAIGHWRSKHRQLDQRLAGSNKWVEFRGTMVTQKLMNGYANVEDNWLDAPRGAYRGVALRSFDAKTGQWSIWWLDSRFPQGPVEPPVRGSFSNGVGTFYADDVYQGKPIRVRYIWSNITATTCHWEQAFSPDGGKTWETNWLMDFERESQ